MTTIFNFKGKTVGWIKENVIFDMSNLYRAFIEDRSVFSFKAHYLGEFENGFFWDKKGKAHDGPITPITEIPPIPPIHPISPISPIPPIPPIPPVHTFNWSQMSFEVFLSQ